MTQTIYRLVKDKYRDKHHIFSLILHSIPIGTSSYSLIKCCRPSGKRYHGPDLRKIWAWCGILSSIRLFWKYRVPSLAGNETF